MSQTVKITTPMLDLEHDEPTQYMLQLMQTSITRKSRKASFIQKYLPFLFSPFGIVLMIILIVPCVSLIFSISQATTITDLIRNTNAMILLITQILYGIFSFWYFLVLVFPLPIKGGMLDLNKNEKFYLSGILGNERWSYLTRKLEIELPLKRLQPYLYSSLFTLTSLLLISLPYQKFSKDIKITTYVHFWIVMVIFVFLLILLLNNIFRTSTALKLIMFNVNWNTISQQLWIVFWVIWWVIIGIIAKIIILPDFGDPNDYLEMIFVKPYKIFIIFVLLSISVIICIFKLISIFRRIINLGISSVKEFIKMKLTLYTSLVFGLVWILIDCISQFTKIKNTGSRFIDLGHNIPVLNMIIIILLTMGAVKWLYNSMLHKKFKVSHLIIYLTSVIVIFTTYSILTYYKINFKDWILVSFISKYLSIYITLPSIWIFCDSSFANIMNMIADWNNAIYISKSIQSLIQLYIVVSVIPSLFARFMENIALQVPSRPKI